MINVLAVHEIPPIVSGPTSNSHHVYYSKTIHCRKQSPSCQEVKTSWLHCSCKAWQRSWTQNCREQIHQLTWWKQAPDYYTLLYSIVNHLTKAASAGDETYYFTFIHVLHVIFNFLPWINIIYNRPCFCLFHRLLLPMVFLLVGKAMAVFL